VVTMVITVALQKYDEKVDLWSIGALLYKVIVGQCGFYAVSDQVCLYSGMILLCVVLV